MVAAAPAAKRQRGASAASAAAVAATLPMPVCLLCRRKFSSEEALSRHERLSELHRQSVEQQDEVVLQHKQDILNGIATVRQQLMDAASAEGGSGGARYASLETQLRQLLGEFGMAQEMLEHSRGAQAGATGRRRKPASLELRLGQLTLDLGVACWQGGKEVQEDRYLLDLQLTSSDGKPVVGFCVLDGHSGSRCVDHLVDRLPGLLQACLKARAALTEDVLREAAIEACEKADEEFLTKARHLEMMDGSTLILGFLFQAKTGSYRLLVANVGDSRAVLCRASGVGKAMRLNSVRLSDDHKPNRPDEQRRIVARNGVVDHHGVWRVFVPSAVSWAGRSIPRWGLAVSRAFGDLLLKEPERFGCSSVRPGGLVIADPEFRSAEVDPEVDRFLILACDGIWDVLRDEDAIAVCASQAGAALAAHSLVRHSFAAGSSDNLTALIVTWRKDGAA